MEVGPTILDRVISDGGFVSLFQSFEMSIAIEAWNEIPCSFYLNFWHPTRYDFPGFN